VTAPWRSDFDAGRAAKRLREAGHEGAVALLFGNERAGLTNDEVALADLIVMAVKLASINLGQAVLILCYSGSKRRIQRPLSASIMRARCPRPAGCSCCSSILKASWKRAVSCSRPETGPE
jgi:tRNA C32,U32 (ribose-2'-O)-methylase TrmJ